MAVINFSAVGVSMVNAWPYQVGDILSIELADRYGYEYRPCVVNSIEAFLYLPGDKITIDVVISWFDSVEQKYRSALLQGDGAKKAKVIWSAKACEPKINGNHFPNFCAQKDSELIT